MKNSIFKTYFAVDINSTSFDVWLCVRLCKGSAKGARRGPRAEAFVSKLYKVTISCMTLERHCNNTGRTKTTLGQHRDDTGMTLGQQWDDTRTPLVDKIEMTSQLNWDNTGTTLLGWHWDDTSTTLVDNTGMTWHWDNTRMTLGQH